MHLPASDPQHTVRGVLAVRACICRPRWCRAATWWGRPPPLLLSCRSCFLTKQNGSTIQPRCGGFLWEWWEEIFQVPTLYSPTSPRWQRWQTSVSSPPSPCPSSSPSSVSVSFFLSFRRPVLESECIRRKFALKVWLEVRFFWHKLSLICQVSWRMMTALANYDVFLKPHKWQTQLSESTRRVHTGTPLYTGLCFLVLHRYCFFNKLKACGHPALWDDA